MTSPSELLLIDEMSYDTYEALLPYITALPLPVQTSGGNVINFPINVNTASEELLNCVGGGSNPVGSALKQEISSSGPYTDAGDVLTFIENFLNSPQNFNASDWPLDVKSDYFQLSTRAEFGDLILQMQHVVERGSQSARVLMRSYGEQW
jgi:type II secretory pathway component PulK